MWWLRRLNGQFLVLDENSGDGGDGGGGNAPDLSAQLKAEKERNDALEKRLAAIEARGSGAGSGEGGADLAELARKKREQEEASGQNQKKLEAALRFGMESPQWLKDNASLLPKTVSGIFEQAAKENYGNAVEKDSAIKAGIVAEFFSIQDNVDLLTPALKSALEDFNKLTKNVKQERAQAIYENVFEPAFEMKKRIAKAAQLAKGGGVDLTDQEAAYKEKLMKHSRKNLLGEN